jgi:hypothetical protein
MVLPVQDGEAINMRERTVHSDEFGEAWPLSVNEGILRKYKEGPVEAVTITVGDTTYALNGGAKTLGLGAAVEPIWSAAETPGLNKNIGPLIDAGLALQPSSRSDSVERQVVSEERNDPPPRLLREFLYVDFDKVRSLLAQLDGGVPEERRQTEKSQARSGIGVKAIASHGREWGTEDSVQRSLVDAVFPSLEEQLEAEGFLADLSAELQTEAYWSSRAFRAQTLPGSFVRVTAPAHLFDARYVAQSFSAFAAAIGGFLSMSPEHIEAPPKGSKAPPRGPRSQVESSSAQLEDSIPEFPRASFLQDVDAKFLRSMARLTRGIFTPGLHLIATPAGEGGPSVFARLQEGMKYLESDAELLFARYGTEPQEWTVVGTVGSFGPPTTSEDQAAPDFVAPDGNGLDRVAMLKAINAALRHQAWCAASDRGGGRSVPVDAAVQ